MTVRNDLDINRSIRRVMVKHWIDLGRVSVRSTQGRVLIRGALQRVPGTPSELTTPLVEAMMAEMKRLPGVKRIQAHLDNWIQDGGRWRLHERAASTLDNVDSLGEGGGSFSVD